MQYICEDCGLLFEDNEIVVSSEPGASSILFGIRSTHYRCKKCHDELIKRNNLLLEATARVIKEKKIVTIGRIKRMYLKLGGNKLEKK